MIIELKKKGLNKKLLEERIMYDVGDNLTPKGYFTKIKNDDEDEEE